MVTPIDLDSLSDEEVLALGPQEIETLQEQENASEAVVTTDPVTEVVVTDELNTEIKDDDSSNTNEVESNSVQEVKETKETLEVVAVDKPEVIIENSPVESVKEEPVVQEDNKHKPAPKKDDKSPEATQADKEGLSTEQVTEAVGFWKTVTAPFKADGKDVEIRTPQDAIRLMQMGVNYSRRMSEMKPLRAQDAMLKDNGINSVQQLNELIDLSKGKPEAIQKFLKDKNIDPLDLDISKASDYKTPNYQGDPKDIAFKDAIDNTLASEGGPELLKDVNQLWDESSKEALRDSPSIFENLLEQKNSGVYEQIKTELTYQRTMGHLTTVPFLQAYHQVGAAMQKAGIFNSTNEVQSNGLAPLSATPIDTGIRKAAPKPETEQPNPDLSSITQPAATGSSKPIKQHNEPDYSSMSDEEMMNLAPPG